MARLISYRQGDIAEYWAQVFLSAFSFSNPVFRQEDYGIDFHCSLIEERNKQAYTSHAFNVQVKSDQQSNVLEFKNIINGNITWLNELQDPYFFAFFDSKKFEFLLYSVALVHKVSALKFQNINHIHLEFDKTPGEAIVWQTPEIINDIVKFNIQKPFLHLTIEDLKDKSKMQDSFLILKAIIEFEKKTAVFRKLKLPLISWLHKYETNKMPKEFGWEHYATDINKNLFNSGEILYETGHILIALAESYKNNGNIETYLELRKVIQLLPLDNNYASYLKNLRYFNENGEKIV